MRFSPLKYFSSTFLINCIFLPLLLSIKQSDKLRNSAILEGVQNIGEKLKQGPAFLVIGDAYYNLGDFRQALHNQNIGVQNIGDKLKQGPAFLVIGDAYYNLGDFRQALHNHELYLSYIEEEDRAAIGRAWKP